MLVAISIRLILNFRHSLAPGMDAAYYPMQTCWLIQHGELMFSDMPLMFWMNTVLTKLLMLGGYSLEHAAQFSSRLIDCLVQPWTAVPIMMLGFTWSKGRLALLPFCIAAATLTVLSPPIMRMAGDFQKNSLGLVWMAFSIWSLRDALIVEVQFWKWLRVGLFFILTALTHVGAFSITTVILSGCLMGVGVHGGIDLARKHFRKCLLFAILAIAAIIGIFFVMSQVAPMKTQRFLDLDRIASKFNTHIHPLAILAAGVIYSLLAIALRSIWRRRSTMQPADFAIGFGTISGLVVMSLPVLDGTWLMRFQLMTPVPGAILLMLLMTEYEIDRKQPWLQRVALAFAGLLMIVGLFFPQGPVISDAAADELKAAKIEFTKTDLDWTPTGKDRLVIAPHGIEFWAGLFLGTQVKQNLPANLDEFESVLILEPKAGMMGNRPGPEMPPPALPHGNRQRTLRSQRHPQENIDVPADATIFYQGDLFTLYQVK